MTKHQKICLIHTFRDAVFEKNQQAMVQDYSIQDSFEIDRFLLKDILHLMNQYEREICQNDIH